MPNESFVQLINISPNSLIFLEEFYLEFLYIRAWFTEENSKLLVNLSFIIN